MSGSYARRSTGWISFRHHDPDFTGQCPRLPVGSPWSTYSNGNENARLIMLH
jgi:hypothetical protein